MLLKFVPKYAARFSPQKFIDCQNISQLWKFFTIFWILCLISTVRLSLASQLCVSRANVSQIRWWWKIFPKSDDDDDGICERLCRWEGFSWEWENNTLSASKTHLSILWPDIIYCNLIVSTKLKLVTALPLALITNTQELDYQIRLLCHFLRRRSKQGFHF